MFYIVPITKDERKYIAGKYPKAHVVRLRKGDSKRHHYLVAEDPPLIAALKEFRENSNKNFIER